MSNVQPLVSIIIPVYKVEKYLKACVDSVCSQTYANLEIILVDDGSPDRCGQMCDQYAAEDPRIKVLHQCNGGVAKARNAGLACAKGAYLLFVDSDDLVEKHAVELLLATALEYNADMVCSICRKIDEEDSLLEDCPVEQSPVCMDKEQALRYYAPAEWAPWNRLIRASVHEGIFFPPYKIHEDEAIKFLLLDRCSKVVQMYVPTYDYRQRAGSATSEGSAVDRMDMFYSRNGNLMYLSQHYPNLLPLFLPKVCDAALLNLGLVCRRQRLDDEKRLSELVCFFIERQHEIWACRYLTTAQKLRCFLIVRSDWRKEKNLYTRFYGLLNSLRGCN